MGGKLLILNLLPFKVSWGMSFTFSETLPESEIGLHNLIIEDKADATAYHIPEGTLLIYDPKNFAKNGTVSKVSSTAVVPNILTFFNVEIPGYMKYEKMDGLGAN